jgi:chromosome partitioning protein
MNEGLRPVVGDAASCVIIAVVSDKGGVGKTTCATSVAHGLTLHAQRTAAKVLLIDFDLLGQDAIVLGMDPEPGVYEHLVLAAPAQQVIRETGRAGLHLLPGNSWTRKADIAVRGRPLAELVAQVRALAAGHAYVVLDTHPSGLLQEVAMRVADALVLPVRLEALALDGAAATLEMVRAIGQPGQSILLPTMYDERLTSHRSNYALLQRAFGGMVAAPVPNRVAVAEAHAAGQTVWEYPDRRGELEKVRAAYRFLIDWLLARPEQILFGPLGKV